MNIPDFQKLMHPFLEAIKDGRVYSTEQIVEMLRVHFSLTMDDMKVKVPNGNQSLFRNRIDWASNHLHQAGLVASFLKGYYQITEAGEQALTQERAKTMDTAYLRKFDQFQAWETMFDESKALPENTRTVEVEMQNETPEIIIGKATLMLYQSLKFELLSVIKSRPISFFEYFIVELLKKIGYKGVDSSNFEVIEKLAKIGIESQDWFVLGCLATIRYETETSIGLMALDESRYFNVIDYELELEVSDYEQGKRDFRQFLSENGITYQKAPSKLIRFIKSMKKC